MSVFVQTLLLLAVLNVFMNFPCYAHLRNLGQRPLYVDRRFLDSEAMG